MAKVKKTTGYKAQRRFSLATVYAILAVLSVIWLFPIVWIVLTSFRAEGGAFVPYIIPKSFTLDNYRILLQNTTGNYPFVRWFLNTLFVSVISCILSTFITIAMAYALSRLRFKMRKPFLKVALGPEHVPRIHEHDRRVLHPESPEPDGKSACFDSGLFRGLGAGLLHRQRILRYDPDGIG
jgi:ABC-type maltose transport system permease subunit